MNTTDTNADREHDTGPKTEAGTEPDTDGEQPTDDSQIPLPQRFLVTASGPVTCVATPAAGVTQRAEVEISIEHAVNTLEQFGAFYELHNRTHWKANAAREVLERHNPADVDYRISDEQLEEWEVEVDARVEAFTGLVETMAGVDGEAIMCDALDLPRPLGQQIKNLHGGSLDVDDCLERITDDLRRSDLWGPGTQLAYLNIRNAHQDLEIDYDYIGGGT